MTISWGATGLVQVEANADAVKDDIAAMVADNPVPARVQEYAATSMELNTQPAADIQQ